jgi:hypothetical protein
MLVSSTFPRVQLRTLQLQYSNSAPQPGIPAGFSKNRKRCGRGSLIPPVGADRALWGPCGVTRHARGKVPGQRRYAARTVNLPAQPTQVRTLAPPQDGKPPPTSLNAWSEGVFLLTLSARSGVDGAWTGPPGAPGVSLITLAGSTPEGLRRSGCSRAPESGQAPLLHLVPYRDAVPSAPGTLQRVHPGTEPERHAGVSKIAGRWASSEVVSLPLSTPFRALAHISS